jgi:hypothetical protein
VALDRAVARVRVDLQSLRRAVAAEPNPPSTVSSTVVTSALNAAATTRAETLALIATTDAKTTDAVSAASKLAGNAATILANAC